MHLKFAKRAKMTAKKYISPKMFLQKLQAKTLKNEKHKFKSESEYKFAYKIY